MALYNSKVLDSVADFADVLGLEKRLTPEGGDLAEDLRGLLLDGLLQRGDQRVRLLCRRLHDAGLGVYQLLELIP